MTLIELATAQDKAKNFTAVMSAFSKFLVENNTNTVGRVKGGVAFQLFINSDGEDCFAVNGGYVTKGTFENNVNKVWGFTL